MMARELSSSATNITMIDDGSSEQIQRWNSPIPYLFGGLALMLILIAVALLILACSYKSSSSSSNDDDAPRRSTEKPAPRRPSSEERGNDEPRIVVIMAGDHRPTYLARPLPSPMISFVR